MISIIKLIFNLIKKLPGLKGFFKDEIKVVRRLPPAKTLRANILGISMGLYFVLGMTFFQFDSIYGFFKEDGTFAYQAWYVPFILTLLFMAGPYLLGGFYTILLAFLAFLFYEFSPVTEFLKSVETLVQWNLIGYGFGAVFALLYNDLVFLYLTVLEEKYKIAFAYKPSDRINIIKSPYEVEEKALLKVLNRITTCINKIIKSWTRWGKSFNAWRVSRFIKKAYKKMSKTEQDSFLIEMSRISSKPDFDGKLDEIKTKLKQKDSNTITIVKNELEPLVEKKLKWKEYKLYNFELDEEPHYPYTILFVANPYIRRRRETINSDYEHEKDLIMKFPDLFYDSVDRALRSLESNEVLGSPEIWSRIRVVTIFDDDETKTFNEDFALLEEFQEDLIIGNDIPENLLDPMQEMNARVKTMLKDHLKVDIETNDKLRKNGRKKILLALDHIDVIFGMSAWLTHDRCMAHFTDYDENAGRTAAIADKGKIFKYKPDPQDTKKHNNKYFVNIKKTFDNCGCDHKKKPFHHEEYATSPGRVALNVFGANHGTFIHEFAHAMSSYINGAITDEYADLFELRSPGFVVNTNNEPPFYVNRTERNKPGGGKFIPVHKIFADYENVEFHSDLAHPSIKENWLGYFPERQSPLISCIMDRYTGLNQFDKLISNFMYDRLAVKLNRNKRPNKKS